MPLISVLSPDAVADEVPHGREAAGGWKKRGMAAFSRQVKPRRAMLPTGQQTMSGLGREGWIAAIFSATRRVRSEVATVKFSKRRSKFSSSAKVWRYRAMTSGRS